MKKFIPRHKAALVLCLAVMAALLAGGIYRAGIQSVHITVDREIAFLDLTEFYAYLDTLPASTK